MPVWQPVSPVAAPPIETAGAASPSAPSAEGDHRAMRSREAEAVRGPQPAGRAVGPSEVVVGELGSRTTIWVRGFTGPRGSCRQRGQASGHLGGRHDTGSSPGSPEGRVGAGRRGRRGADRGARTRNQSKDQAECNHLPAGSVHSVRTGLPSIGMFAKKRAHQGSQTLVAGRPGDLCLSAKISSMSSLTAPSPRRYYSRCDSRGPVTVARSNDPRSDVLVSGVRSLKTEQCSSA